jgi:hypothetical protein
MASSPAPADPAHTDTDAVCSVEAEFRKACRNEPVYRQHDRKPYCVLHLPANDKDADFRQALDRKLAQKDFNFLGVWFPARQHFHDFDFHGRADFSFATFSGDVYFSNVNFGFVEFKHTVFRGRADFGWKVEFRGDAVFSDAIFRDEATFSWAVFKGGYFGETHFRKRVSFFNATFREVAAFSATFNGEADFRLAVFEQRASFNESTFNDRARFSGQAEHPMFTSKSVVRFAFARFARPELISFHTVGLRAEWFANVEARKLDFTNVEWSGTVGLALAALAEGHERAPHRVLEKACQQLAVNAEDNQRYDEASRFRYWAMDARRRQRVGGLAWWRLDWWYWAASGYGERVSRAFVVLIALWLGFATLYTQTGFVRWTPEVRTAADATTVVRDRVGQPMPLSAALVYSLGVLSLQKPDPAPATATARYLVMAETILGPLQAALLALAIRRKFMR